MKELSTTQLKRIAAILLIVVSALYILTRATKRMHKHQPAEPTYNEVEKQKKQIDEQLEKIQIDSVDDLPAALRELQW